MNQYIECITPNKPISTTLPASDKYLINYWIDVSDEEIQSFIDEAKEHGYICRTTLVTPEEIRSHIYERLINKLIKT